MTTGREVDDHLYDAAVQAELEMRQLGHDAFMHRVGRTIDGAKLFVAYWRDGSDPSSRHRMILKGTQKDLDALVAAEIGKTALALIVSEKNEALALRQMVEAASAFRARTARH